MGLRLRRTPGDLAVAGLPPAHRVPEWATGDGGGFLSVTRTPHELSVVCASHLVPAGLPAERGWRRLEVEGPLDFALTGVLAGIAGPLAEAGIPLFVVSTHDTDHVLVKEADLPAAERCLRAAGHEVCS